MAPFNTKSLENSDFESRKAFSREQIESGLTDSLLRWLWRCPAVACEQKPQRFLGDPLSCDRLHIRAHHIGHSADFGGLPDFIVGCLFLLSAIAKSFDGNIQSDFVSVLEAIRHCFGWRIDRNFYALNLSSFDTVQEGRPGVANDF